MESGAMCQSVLLGGPLPQQDLEAAEEMIRVISQATNGPKILFETILGFEPAMFAEVLQAHHDSGLTFQQLLAAYLYNQRVVQMDLEATHESMLLSLPPPKQTVEAHFAPVHSVPMSPVSSLGYPNFVASSRVSYDVSPPSSQCVSPSAFNVFGLLDTPASHQSSPFWTGAQNGVPMMSDVISSTNSMPHYQTSPVSNRQCALLSNNQSPFYSPDRAPRAQVDVYAAARQSADLSYMPPPEMAAPFLPPYDSPLGMKSVKAGYVRVPDIQYGLPYSTHAAVVRRGNQTIWQFPA